MVYILLLWLAIYLGLIEYLIIICFLRLWLAVSKATSFYLEVLVCLFLSIYLSLASPFFGLSIWLCLLPILFLSTLLSLFLPLYLSIITICHAFFLLSLRSFCLHLHFFLPFLLSASFYLFLLPSLLFSLSLCISIYQRPSSTLSPPPPSLRLSLYLSHCQSKTTPSL